MKRSMHFDTSRAQQEAESRPDLREQIMLGFKQLPLHLLN